MTRQEAIKILDKYDLNFCDIDGNSIPPQDLAEAFDMAIEALEQQTAKCDNCKYSEETDGMNCYECVKGISDNFEALEQAPKWIPVTKALPTKGVKVLVQTSYPNLTYVAEIGSFLSQPEGWRTADGYERIEQTVAWMPLPKPYKEETEQW